MVVSEWSSSKSVLVLAIVVGCFAVLWPKIFLPMFRDSFSLVSPPKEKDHIDSIVHPRVRATIQKPGVDGSIKRRETVRSFPGMTPPSRRGEPPKQGGVMGFVMPLYTVGIIVFFLYTLLKVAVKRRSDEDYELPGYPGANSSPMYMNYNLDSEYRKLVLSEHYDHTGNPIRLEERGCCSASEVQSCSRSGRSERSWRTQEDEVEKLRKRLKETEAAMKVILNHMGNVSEKLMRNGAISQQVMSQQAEADESQEAAVEAQEDDERITCESGTQANESADEAMTENGSTTSVENEESKVEENENDHSEVEQMDMLEE